MNCLLEQITSVLATKLAATEGQEGAQVQRYAPGKVPSSVGKGISLEEVG